MFRKPWVYIALCFVIIIIGIVVFVRQTTPKQIFNLPLVKETLVKKTGPTKKALVDLLPTFLGFEKPKTYLVLFENNTELRPGGGFIGTYALVNVDNGSIHPLVVEGTESLDNRVKDQVTAIPPKIIQEKLGLGKWYFRDSNWSPDFVESSKKALEFYAAENGQSAQDIDAVIALTPTVLEELLKITGPITVQGVEFNAKNVVNRLEYEVEFGFEHKGIDFANRKQIIEPFFHAVLKKVAPDALLHTSKYMDLFDTLAKQKQILVYFKDTGIQKTMQEYGWTGDVKAVDGDFVMWVDANLGALKTDQVMQRNLQYMVQPVDEKNSEFVAHAKMQYMHTGVYDKFTSRYRTYARVYVPLGSVLKEVNTVQNNGQKTRLTTIDQGFEVGKQWYGVFITIEPKENKELEFVYTLPPRVTSQIHGRTYTLLVQKQAGLTDARLTLRLNFGTNITSASPAEEQKEWGNAVYNKAMNFDTDQKFEVKM